MRLFLGIALSLFATMTHAASAPECSASSGERRIALLALYTSEGCDSCPPTDRWVSELPRRGYPADRLVILSFHVDYWDYIGWRDPFGQARFSERQRVANARNASRVVYTPQLMLNGKDFRARNELGSRLGEINRAPAQASIRLSRARQSGHLSVTGAWTALDDSDARNGQGWLALYENGLATDVRAGENRGKRLQHDFVVRDLAGPFPAGSFAHVFPVAPTWQQAHLQIAAFVQDVRTGAPLQALALAPCRN